MNFEEYFKNQFRADLKDLFSAMTPGMREHLSVPPASYSLSMNILVEPDLGLKAVPLDRRPHLAVSLFFAALMDQSMHYHHRGVYERFRRMTDYPKLKGACPGACMHMAKPRIALICLNLFDSDPSEYIRLHTESKARSKVILQPIVEEGRAYFLEDFPKFLRKIFPEIAEPDSFARRIFSEEYSRYDLE